MGRILAIDYGLKRVGLATTDPLKIIASPLITIATKETITYLREYTRQEDVERFVVGMPKNLQNKDTDATAYVHKFIDNLKKAFPNLAISEIDERFTSKMASAAMVSGGMKKKDRKSKDNIDKVSAAIILQSYLDSHPTF